MPLLLRIVALLLFLLAAISAFAEGVNFNEMGFIALGLAAWVGSAIFVDTHTA